MSNSGYVRNSLRTYSYSRDNFKSRFGNMRQWLASLNATLDARNRVQTLMAVPLWRVCYGGVFAASRSSIMLTPSAYWESMSTSLARSDNLEEGHFAERSWAAILSVPPLLNEARALRQAAACVTVQSWHGFLGTLNHCQCF